MAKLNPNAQKWVDALRSGKYQQGKDCLGIEGRFCCLGVLCEVAIENSVAINKKVDSRFYVYDDQDLYAPQSVMEWAGLRDSRGIFGDNSLARLNDAGQTFEQIATAIEEHAEELGVSA